MTDDNNKLRAVFLAALMVLWVFAGTVAFAGGAAALDSGSIDNTDVSPNGSTGASNQDYTVSFEYDPDPGAESGGMALNLTDASGGTTGGNVSSPSNVIVTYDNSSARPLESEGSFTGDEDGDGTPDTLFVDFNRSIEPSDGDTLTVEFKNAVDNPDVEDDYVAEARSYEGNNPFSGNYVADTDTYRITGAATDDDEQREVDADFAGGSTRWKGQNLYFDARPSCSNGNTEDYQLRYFTPGETSPTGNLIREISLNDTTEAQIPTNNVADNEDVVITAPDPDNGNTQRIIEVDQNGRQTADCFTNRDGEDDGTDDSVEIVPQTLDAEFEEDPTRVNDNVTMEVDSNRNGYDLYVSSDDFSQGDLEGVIQNSSTSTDINEDRAPSDDAVIVRNLQSSDTVVFNFDETGNYSFDLSPTDTTASDNASIQVQEDLPDDADFTDRSYSVARGDVQTDEGDSDATISVESEDVDFVVIIVGDESRNNYETAILAEPEEVDGQSEDVVDIRMNTFLAGQADNGEEHLAYEAINGEIVNVNRRTPELTGVLDEGQYDLTIENRDGEELDAAVLNIQPSSYENLTQYRHPDTALSNADEPEELTTNSTQANLTESELVTLSDRDRSDVQRDLLVHEVQITGIFGVLDAIRNTSTSADSLDGVNGNNILDEVQDPASDIDGISDGEVTGRFLIANLTQTNFKQNREPKEELYEDGEIDDPGFEFVIDEDNETLYLVTDVKEITLEREVGDQNAPETGLEATNEEDYDFEFRVGPAYNETFEGGIDTYKPSGTETTFVDLEDREAEFDPQGADETQVDNEANVTISGQTNVAPGTVVSVSATDTARTRRADDNDTNTDREPIFETETAVVQAGNSSSENTFSGEFNQFDEAEVGQEFTLTAQNAGIEDEAERDGVVVEGRNAQVGLSDITVPADQDELSTITVDSAYFPQGGFVTIHDGSLQDGATIDSIRGTSDYIEADTEVTDVEVELDDPYTEDGTAIAMAHQDTNDNEEYDFVTSEGEEDGFYENDEGGPVINDASVTFETPTPTASPSPTPTASPSPTPTASPTPTSDQPGFGAVLALIALIGAALLAARRNDF